MKSAKWLSLGVLTTGILFGGLGTSLVLHLPVHPSSFLAAVTAVDEDDLTSTLLEHQLFEEHPVASTTSPVFSEDVAGKSEASATSSGAIKIPVMIYHSVRPHIMGESALQDAYDVTPELLDQELSYIRDHGYTTITFADVIANFDTGTPLPPKPVILSFDDGWRNQYTYAFPLLKKYDLKGTFFIFTNPIGRKPHWMTWEEIKEMDKAGMEIGGHSRTHPVLTKITTDAGLDHEIAGGKTVLEGELGHQIVAFAYPFGATNVRVEDAVKRAGFLLARTTFWGIWNDPAHRLEFHGALSTDNIADFERLLNKE